ncbi:4-hydroxybenzoate polyprenyltransferase [Sphingorhabdus lutea]|uniref:4-hydroxybenzoate octaprenyltransferase n=1 Tax=Sphingorhabdus lutea TaxID=1913578 RepID=A0A1L3JB36_9SPHN|nr:4-hydroxybenzoate octaprenyltransferase [Sphingorhabdus lutea]APG62273.1 4-hydroxybenzoate polyprenyltransferase [Sphingorhabdus lutea]
MNDSISKNKIKADAAAQNIMPQDSQDGGWIAALSEPFRSLGLLARFDRPIGIWLLFWPCIWGWGLAGGRINDALAWPLILWFLLGAAAMRGAGCVINDIIDRDLDAQVARTAARPLAAKTISVRAAYIWLGVLCLVGLLVLLQLRVEAQIAALISIIPVAVYPMMKRITWWPQIWLGMVFSWGSLVGYLAIAGTPNAAMWLLYLGNMAWVVGYDSIYAMQDREDDALVGIKSSALRMGGNIRIGVAIFYAAAIICWVCAFWTVRPHILVLAALIPAALHMIWQLLHLHVDGRNAIILFRRNAGLGLFMALACITIGMSA